MDRSGRSRRGGDATSLHVRRAVDGDGDSLAWVVDRLDPFVHAQVRLRLGTRARNAADVDDLAAEAWSVTLARIGDLAPREGRWAPVLVAFLGRTVTNVCNAFLRRAIRARVAEEDGDDRPRVERVPDVTRGVLTRVGERDVHRAVEEALERLGEAQREVLVLRLLEQNDNADVARALGVAPNTAAQRYRRALAELRAVLPAGVYADLRELTGGEGVGDGG